MPCVANSITRSLPLHFTDPSAATSKFGKRLHSAPSLSYPACILCVNVCAQSPRCRCIGMVGYRNIHVRMHTHLAMCAAHQQDSASWKRCALFTQDCTSLKLSVRRLMNMYVRVYMHSVASNISFQTPGFARSPLHAELPASSIMASFDGPVKINSESASLQCARTLTSYGSAGDAWEPL